MTGPPTTLHLFRAYVLYLIGSRIMPNNSGNLVHLSFLQLLDKSPEEVGQYSWGSACLATLYRSLCDGAIYGNTEMPGCTILLQAWAWSRMSCLAPVPRIPPQAHAQLPLANIWLEHGNKFVENPRHNLVCTRLKIDTMTYDQFSWRPYVNFNYNNEEESQIWSANTYLICFQIVERHQTDRVRLQFGLPQHPPSLPENLKDFHKINLSKDRIKGSWGDKHHRQVQNWNQRHQLALHGVRYNHEVYPNRQYFAWYWKFFGDYLWLSREVLLSNPRQACASILPGLPRDYPAVPQAYTVPDENMWSNTPPPYNQFMTPPPTNFDQTFNPSTNYNYNQTYQSPPQPTNQILHNTPIPYPSYSQQSHHGESSRTSNYSFDDYNPTQYTTQTGYPDQSQYSSFNLPTPPHFVNYPQTSYAPQWPNSQTNPIENLAAGFNDDDFVNEIWTNSASQMQNEVAMETNDDAEILDEDVEEEEEEEDEAEEQHQRPLGVIDL
ncbi:uncharacterized protein [Medicago truncatula]|uniref:uncharacterized protein n=1 Tax=Medicago truncatula TaxID=3880 RepID=UPI0019688F16|nr:uncharacterized protein LOC120578417 [Medicago truncatula]